MPALYKKHRGKYELREWPDGDPKALDASESSSIDAVLDFYGDKPGYVLSGLTHREEPWLTARKGLAPGERGNNVITWESMSGYYGSLI